MKQANSASPMIFLNAHAFPRVLLLGNGILKLCGGISWEQLLEGIQNRKVPAAEIKKVPYCMQPELLSSAEAEVIRRQVGEKMSASAPCISPQLEKLLALDFDCILTTNYTYEVETILTGGRWNERMRRKCLRVVHGSSHVHHNLSICYQIPRTDRPPVQVWHIHGDAMRHASLILSYYSYAAAMFKLQEYNKQLGNTLLEYQQAGKPLPVHSWLDWFLAGDVYTVGYGFDFSEIDLWWALERKKREKANVGRLYHLNLEEKMPADNKSMLEALGAHYEGIVLESGSWENGYEAVIDRLKKMGLSIAENSK